ncbi:hypothetical protein [Achromobacter phage Motura]|uniref:Lipoprotein n=1 Tax=Achromobacter phage Motura TaxID=2591403 RepID=A0A514CT75_9CAUD|nr:hypothetical protein H1O15_gp086 [Achromobacter phage Motura]QDH83664.1 hypothetical protein [Achromobacter phage Motura]
MRIAVTPIALALAGCHQPIPQDETKAGSYTVQDLFTDKDGCTVRRYSMDTSPGMSNWRHYVVCPKHDSVTITQHTDQTGKSTTTSTTSIPTVTK